MKLTKLQMTHLRVQGRYLDIHWQILELCCGVMCTYDRNMRRMCEESKDMGLKCMGSLENQGECIEKWEEVADGINEDMKLAEKALKDMDRACFGFIPRFWKIGGGFKEDDAVWREPEMPKNECLPEAKTLNPDHRFVATSEESGEMNEKEKEMEENMDEVCYVE